MRASILSAENRGDGAPEMPSSVRQQMSKIVMPTCFASNVPNGAVAGAAFR
jgi:hypothetical protein